jgi:hypothetical protein
MPFGWEMFHTELELKEGRKRMKVSTSILISILGVSTYYKQLERIKEIIWGFSISNQEL